jgi:hypothetical protein
MGAVYLAAVWKPLWILAVGCATPAGTPSAPGTANPPGIAAVRPATLVWDIGIDAPGGPSPLVETILPAVLGKTEVWRIVHRDLDPTADGAVNGYDMYDVDRATGAPLRSVMQRDGFRLALTFAADRVTIERQDGKDHLRSEARVAHPAPEGPGEQVMLASLPLRNGYTTTLSMVDRWAKDEANRVVEVDVSVTGPQQIRTRLGMCAVFEVVLAPRNGAFRIRDWARASPPHYALRTEYTRGDLHLISEVKHLLLEDGPGS